jgi:excisionase family DNA binding protein
MRAASRTRLLTTAETAHLLGVSKDSVQRAVRAGTLEAVRLRPGGHPRFRLADIERLIAGRPGDPA